MSVHVRRSAARCRARRATPVLGVALLAVAGVVATAAPSAGARPVAVTQEGAAAPVAAAGLPVAPPVYALKGVAVQALVRSTGVVVVAGTNRGLYRSLDGGTAWRRVGPTSSVSELAVNATAARFVYAAVGVGRAATVWRSVDSGLTWRALPRPTGGFTDGGPLWAMYASRTVVMVGTGEGRLWVSRNGGATWTRRTLGFGNQVYDITAQPGSPIVWISGGSQIYTTRDNGATISPSYMDGIPAQPRITTILVNGPLNDQSVLHSFCGNTFGNYTSDIGQYAWSYFGQMYQGRVVDCSRKADARINQNLTTVGNGRFIASCSNSGCGPRALLRTGRVLATSWGAPARRGGAPRVLVGTTTGLTRISGTWTTER